MYSQRKSNQVAIELHVQGRTKFNTKNKYILILLRHPKNTYGVCDAMFQCVEKELEAR
jgi:hypothetical protein